MWKLEPTDQFQKDMAWYQRKKPTELAAVLNNLNRFMSQLNHAKNALCVQAGYIHTEGRGVIAVDERAGGPNLEATRLYLYAHEPTGTVHLITIGNKAAQPSDVSYSHTFLEKYFPPKS